MSFVEDIEKLLENNLITKDEYSTLLKRISISNASYEFTWEDMLNDFYSWCSERYTVSTAKGYKTCLYKFMLYLTKEDTNEAAMSKKFEMYSFQKVNNFINKMYADNFKNQSISKTKYAIIVFGEYLRSLNISTPDVKDIKISIKKEVNNTTIALSHDEVISIAEHGELRNKICLLLCYEGALKRSELCHIKVQDFNLNNNQLVIYDDNGNVVRVCSLTKTTVKFVKIYIDELYDNIKSWNSSREARGREPREDFGYIFQSVKMVKPSYSLLQTMVKNNAKAYYESLGYKGEELLNKIQQVTFESIRNSRKVLLLANGYSVADVMKLCGEKNYMGTHRFEALVPLLYPKNIV